MVGTLRGFATDQKGAAAIEYALVASLVSVALIAVLILLGASLSDQVGSVLQAIESAGG